MRDNPTLSPEQIERIRSSAQWRSVQKGEVLYESSQPDVPLFIVLEGSVSVSRTGEDDKILAVREAGQFTGEMSVISGKRSLLKARVSKDGSVLEVGREKILSLVARDTELGDLFIEAFVARRFQMIQLGEGNVVLFGTKSSARTLSLREFLTRNAHPFMYVDIDSDSFAGELMDKLAVRQSELPVVYCNNRYVLRNPSIAELTACLDLNINTDKSVRDFLVIGAGPAGLAAAVYAASEGLKTLVYREISTGRPGGVKLEDRKLPRFSHRAFRAGACQPFHRAGAKVRRSIDGCSIGGAYRLESPTVQSCPRIGIEIRDTHYCYRDGCAICSPAG